MPGKQKVRRNTAMRKPVVIVVLSGGLVEAVLVDDRRYEGASVIVTEKTHGIESHRQEAFIENGELSGDLIYQLATCRRPSPETLEATHKACCAYRMDHGQQP